MPQSTHDGDLYVRGTLRANSLAVPANAVGNDQVNAGDPLAATKVEHQFVKVYEQGRATNLTTTTGQVVHSAYADGEVVEVAAGYTVAGSSWTGSAVVDVKKNGTSVLSGTITLDAGNTVYVPETGTLSTPAYSADDALEVVVTVTAGTGTLPKGLFVRVVLREAAG